MDGDAERPLPARVRLVDKDQTERNDPECGDGPTRLTFNVFMRLSLIGIGAEQQLLREFGRSQVCRSSFGCGALSGWRGVPSNINLILPTRISSVCCGAGVSLMKASFRLLLMIGACVFAALVTVCVVRDREMVAQKLSSRISGYS